MDASHFNVFDAAVAVTLLASGIFAFRRGLLKEVLSLGTWVLASIFTFSFYPLAQPYFHQHIKNPMLADASSALGLFCLSIIVLVPLGEYLTGLIKSPALSSIDRSLGFVFGIVRGFLITCLVFLGLTFIWPEGKEGVQPKWLEEARTKPALAYGVDLVKSIAPEGVEEGTKRQLEASREAAEEAAENVKHLEDISTPIPTYSVGKDAKPSSYGDDARDKMNNLIDRN